MTWYKETINNVTYHYTYLGRYPQTYVGNAMNDILEAEYQAGQMIETGMGYPGSDYILNGFDDSYLWWEYEYNGDFYVRGAQKLNKSDGAAHAYAGSGALEFQGADGDIKWFKVEPAIFWVIDGTNPDNCTSLTTIKLISNTILMGGLPFEEGYNEYVNMFLDMFIYSLQDTLETHVSCNASCLDDFDSEYFDMGSKSDYFLSIQYTSGSDFYGPLGIVSDFAIGNGAYCNFFGQLTAPYWTHGGFATINFQGVWDSDSYSPSSLVPGIRPVVTVNYDPHPAVPFDSNLSKYPGITKKTDGYHITDFTGLQAMSDFTNAGGTFSTSDKFFLDKDIDFTGKTWTPIKEFRGTFDGQGHIIQNFNAAHFIDQIWGTIQNLNILNWNLSCDNTQSISFAGTTFISSNFKNMYITCSLTNNNTPTSGSSDPQPVAVLVMDSGYNNINISQVEIVGNVVSGGIDTPTAIFAVSQGSGTKITVTDSSFRGTCQYTHNLNVQFQGHPVYAPTIADLCWNKSTSSTNTYAGVYMSNTVETATIKNYYTGFTDSQWICGATLNEGYPALRWNLWAGNHATTTSVETYLKNKGFTAAT